MQPSGTLAVDHSPALRAVHIADDDLIVISYHTTPTMDDAREAAAAVREFWPRNKVLILSSDVNILTLSPEQLRSLAQRDGAR